MVFSWGGFNYVRNNSRIVGIIIGFFLVLLAFVVDRWWMGKLATIPFWILKDRTVWRGSIISFLATAFYFKLFYYLYVNLQSVRERLL